jgi:hypothetical protein
MRLSLLVALVAGAAVAAASWPTDADAQSRRRARVTAEAYPGAGYTYSRTRQRTRITVRRARSFLDPGTEVLPQSQSYTDYASGGPLYYPSASAFPANQYRYPLPESYYLPGYTQWGW